LVEIGAVERGLRYLALDRNTKPLAAVVATLLATIARDHVGQPEADVEKIAAIATRLRAKRTGLSSKVRERLRPLKHEPTLARLFLLPTALARSLLRKPDISPGDARLFQRALALALLTVCPLRIGSLCSIRTDRHLFWSGEAMKGDLVIEFAAGELKGDEPGSFPIPRDIANLIRIYWTRYRPLLDPGASPFLFCTKDPARPKNKGQFSMQLTGLVFARLGLWANPHLFRHVVHLVVLRRFPGAYAMVARVLTHRSIATTVKNYSHFDGEISMRAYQRLVEDVKAGGPRQHTVDAAAVAYGLDRERPNHVRR
jgi:integrase